MGVKKKATYKVDNGTDFDEIYFRTSAEQVYLADGTNLQKVVPNKVDKVTGKGLSTNDYSNEEKNKLNSLFSTTKSNIAIAGSLVAATGYLNSIHLSKDGIVTINFGLRYHTANSNGLVTGQTLFTLPSNLRPKQGVIIPALAVRVGGLPNAIGYLYIRETGVVTFALVGDLTAYSQVCGCVTFSIN